jgi:2-oxoacid dehydrogenases acyltransferase (catalytic domain)
LEALTGQYAQLQFGDVQPGGRRRPFSDECLTWRAPTRRTRSRSRCRNPLHGDQRGLERAGVDPNGAGERVVERADQEQDTLTLEDLRGGTFTITNGGVFGSLLSTPILSPPQVGILGMHRTQDRPVARDGQVVIRPMMYLALTYDHRVVDGREAVQFLVRVKELIEDPEALLLEG